jgi:hypothetical protein
MYTTAASQYSSWAGSHFSKGAWIVKGTVWIRREAGGGVGVAGGGKLLLASGVGWAADGVAELTGP